MRVTWPRGTVWMVLLVVCLLLGHSGVTSAQDSSTPAAQEVGTFDVNFSLGPAGGQDLEVFRVEIEPGAIAVLKAEVKNAAETAIELTSFTSNAITKVNGGFGIDKEGSPLQSPGDWLNLEQSIFTLEPGESYTFDLPISVPDGTGPGQYGLAFAVRTVDSYAVPDSGTFRQIIQKNAAIIVTVPGDLTAGFVLDQPEVVIEGGKAVVVVPIENTGNMLVNPEGTLSIRTSSGLEVFSAPVQMQVIFVGHSTTIQTALAASMPPGEYLMSLSLTDARGSAATAELVDVPLTVPDPAEAAQANLVTFGTVSIAPNAEPVQFIAVSAEVINSGEAIGSTRVSLVVSRDGVPVEEYVVVENVPLPSGTSTFTQRYIPLDGFEAGSWSFVVRVDEFSPDGVSTLLAATEEVLIDIP